jgi:hypothetical protein
MSRHRARPKQIATPHEHEHLGTSGEGCGVTDLVPSKRRPPNFERVRDDRVHDHLAGHVHDRHFESWVYCVHVKVDRLD